MTFLRHKPNMDSTISVQSDSSSKKKCPLRLSQIRQRLRSKNMVALASLPSTKTVHTEADQSRPKSAHDPEAGNPNSIHERASRQAPHSRTRSNSRSYVIARSDGSVKGTTQCHRATHSGSDRSAIPSYTQREDAPMSEQPFEAIVTGIGEHVRGSEGPHASFAPSVSQYTSTRRASILQWQLDMERRSLLPAFFTDLRRHTG